MTDGSTVRGREQLSGALEDIAKVAVERDLPSIAEVARVLAERLVEQRLTVVVLGEFKRGKSTVINALLGEELLPAGVLPVTAVVTVVTFGDRRRSEIVFLDGRIEEVLPTELARYVNERENPANRLGVDRAVVNHPSALLAEGVYLVDTPGVGSVHSHNTDIARRFLPEADAAIFVTAADPPISAAERRFLHEVKAEAARMCIVLNKIDYLNRAELAETVSFTRSVVAEALGRDVEVYPVSARLALNARADGDEEGWASSGFARFEHDLARFLTEEKGNAVVASVAGKALQLVGNLADSLAVEEETRFLPAETLATRRSEMEQVFSDAARARQDIATALLDRETGAVLAMVEKDLADFYRTESARLVERGIQAFVSDPGRTAQAMAKAQHLVEDGLQEGVGSWRLEEERRVAAAFESVAHRFVGEANRLISETVRLCSDLLDLHLESLETPTAIWLDSEFSFRSFELPTSLDVMLAGIRSHLPAPLARRILTRRLAEDVPRLVDMHCGRLRWDYQQRLDHSRLALLSSLDQGLDAIMESLRAGVQRAQDLQAVSEAEASARLVETASQGMVLQRIRSLLDRLT
ncbi:MAG: dynamin family protein [Acidimicrobiia bacterium]